MPIMKDGYPCIIVDLGGVAGVLFIEKRVKPPGLDGGPPIDTSGMRNRFYRTTWPRGLVSVTQITIVASYDPMIWASLIALVHGNRLRRPYGQGRSPLVMQLKYSTTDTHNFWGTVSKWDPAELQEGEQPTATITIDIHSVNDGGFETDVAIGAKVPFT